MNGNIDWYSPTEIGNEIYANGSIKKITQLGLEKSSAKILPANKTVLFTSRAGIGDVAILNKDGATNQGFQSLILKDEYDTYFIFSASFLIKNMPSNTHQVQHSWKYQAKQLGNMHILTPEEQEQTKIGNYSPKTRQTNRPLPKRARKTKKYQKASLDKMFV